MLATRFAALCGLILLFHLTACQSRQFPTMTLYESPTSFVRLEADPTVRNAGHSHPVSMTEEEMAAVLSGIMIDEPPRLLSFLDKDKEPPHHPAFTEAEVQFFAPLLAVGLRQATPEEVVTFYQTRQDTAIIRKVTSGGLFVDGEEMHIVLSNYRSPTHYMADPGVDDTTDDRLTPMRSIAPQQAGLDFEPSHAIAPSHKNWLSTLFSTDRRELVVLYRKVAPAKAGAPHAADHDPTKD
ncbi:MAG: hypothetical protein AB7R40_00100 [Nitrospiraceae bacterium]